MLTSSLELLDGLGQVSKSVYGLLYTSPELLLSLYNKGVNAYGMARSNRKYYPNDLKVDKSVSIGYYDFRSSGPLLATVWNDKRIIHFLSRYKLAQLLLYKGERMMVRNKLWNVRHYFQIIKPL